MANSVYPDQMPYSGAADLGQNCLQRPICPNTDNDQVYVSNPTAENSIWSLSTLFAKANLSQYLGFLRYCMVIIKTI